MIAYRRYDEIAVGDQFPTQPLSFTVKGEAVDAFLDATGDTGERYRDAGESGARRAPSMIASVYLIDLLKARASPPGGIHAKQSIRFHRAVNVGETLGLQASIVEKYVRKDRNYAVSEFEARGAKGDLVASGLITSIWGQDL
ncbi:acyl dehydratase [Hoeflea sp. IMCC20628]|uniref:MaoC family dehydratase n=1 Tax=Hoeflea sp. IMCC20628 TaxID=1620421 RepID=UPI00063BF6D2|nr:MaoC family dehydratase N-terminal domain-containing protein [Hoeflea sp. IMCC20628]AKH98839.1 acyl dehydratase [Hoeflea sp. IMCC20628]